MMGTYFGAKRVYPSVEGLHFELYTETEAKAAYDDAKSKNVSVELNGLILTWKFPNPKKGNNIIVRKPLPSR